MNTKLRLKGTSNDYKELVLGALAFTAVDSAFRELGLVSGRRDHDWDDGTVFGYVVCRRCCKMWPNEGECRGHRLRRMERPLAPD